jgi:type I restriction-modification system DNA methylase subunit
MVDFYTDVLKDDIFRKNNGAHFTPQEVVEDMCSKYVLFIKSEYNTLPNNFKFLDIASGTGVFSYFLSLEIEKVFGIPFKYSLDNYCTMVEIDDVFIQQCNNIFNSLGCNPQIIHGDALFNDNLKYESFDLIIGNPPYIRIQNVEPAYRKLLRDKFSTCLFGNSDIYYAFFEQALKLSKVGGCVSLITPSSCSIRNQKSSR